MRLFSGPSHKAGNQRLSEGTATGNLRSVGLRVSADGAEVVGDEVGQAAGSGNFILAAATVCLDSSSFEGGQLSTWVQQLLPADRLDDWRSVESQLLTSFAGIVFLANIE